MLLIKILQPTLKKKKGGHEMNLYVNQSICIHSLKVNAVTNSSLLQIGSVGLVKATSNLFNTGGFTGPAP
jgi:spore germination protein PB